MQRFPGGLVCKAHRRLYHSIVGLRVIKKKKVVRTRLVTCHATPWALLHLIRRPYQNYYALIRRPYQNYYALTNCPRYYLKNGSKTGAKRGRDNPPRAFRARLVIDPGSTRSWNLSGRGTTRAEDAQGTPTQRHISPSVLENLRVSGGGVRVYRRLRSWSERWRAQVEGL